MSGSKSESNDPRRPRLVSRVAASLAILGGSHAAAAKAPDQPANSTRDQSAVTQPVGPDSRSNATPAPAVSLPSGPVDPQPRSVQATPHTNQRPASQPPGLSTPSNRETVGPAHNRPRVEPTGSHSINPTNHRDHPEQPGVIPESEKMLLKGEGTDDIERQQTAERGRRRPQPPTPSAQPIRPDNSRPQHHGRYTPPQPERQPQPPDYGAHSPNREGRRAAEREAGRAPTSSPQNQHPQHQRQGSSPPQHQGPPQRQYSSPQNRAPQSQHARHQQPPNGSGREGNDQPPRRPPSK
jgi:hypothetical protein